VPTVVVHQRDLRGRRAGPDREARLGDDADDRDADVVVVDVGDDVGGSARAAAGRTREVARRPEFARIGGVGGGQWLYRQAASHPETWMPPLEKLRYFKGRRDQSRREALERLNTTVAQIYESGTPGDPRDLEFLRRVWQTSADTVGDRRGYGKLVNVAGDSMVGDISPSYARLRPRAVRGLVRALPRTRFLYLADDPVAKVWKVVRSRVRSGRADAGVLKDPDLLAGYLQTAVLERTLLQSRTVEVWTAKAGPRFAAFQLDAADADPATVRREVFAYLGLDAELCEADPARSGPSRRSRPPTSLAPVIETFLQDEPERLHRAIEATRQVSRAATTARAASSPERTAPSM